MNKPVCLSAVCFMKNIFGLTCTSHCNRSEPFSVSFIMTEVPDEYKSGSNYDSAPALAEQKPAAPCNTNLFTQKRLYPSWTFLLIIYFSSSAICQVLPTCDYFYNYKLWKLFFFLIDLNNKL